MRYSCKIFHVEHILAYIHLKKQKGGGGGWGTIGMKTKGHVHQKGKKDD